MVSTQLTQQVDGLDEQIGKDDKDFKDSGLKAPSLFWDSRIAVVEKSIFQELGSLALKLLYRTGSKAKCLR